MVLEKKWKNATRPTRLCWWKATEEGKKNSRRVIRHFFIPPLFLLALLFMPPFASHYAHSRRRTTGTDFASCAKMHSRQRGALRAGRPFMMPHNWAAMQLWCNVDFPFMLCPWFFACLVQLTGKRTHLFFLRNERFLRNEMFSKFWGKRKVFNCVRPFYPQCVQCSTQISLRHTTSLI